MTASARVLWLGKKKIVLYCSFSRPVLADVFENNEKKNRRTSVYGLTEECLEVCLRSLENSWTRPRVRYTPFSIKN